MGGVAQAVVEFDEAVQAPWRPPLAGGPGQRRALRAVPDLPTRAGTGTVSPPAGRPSGTPRAAGGRRATRCAGPSRRERRRLVALPSPVGASTCVPSPASG